MSFDSVPITDQQAWYEHMIRQQNGVTSHTAAFCAPAAFAGPPAGHVSAAGHYGFQPPAQAGHQTADKENSMLAALPFAGGFSVHNGGSGGIFLGQAAAGHGSGIGPGGACLAARKRARDEVVFQEFKRRRLTDAAPMLSSSGAPVLPPTGAHVVPVLPPVGARVVPAPESSAEEMRSAVAASAHYDALYASETDMIMELHGC